PAPPPPRHGSGRRRPLAACRTPAEMRSEDGVVVAPSHSEEPIRAELFGIERLEQHAESLAAAEQATARPTKGRDLLPRVRDNGRELLAAYHDVVTSAET